MKIYKSLALGITLATIGAVASTASAGDDVKFYVGGKIGGAVFDSDMRYQAVNDDKLGTGAALELNPFVGMQINWNDSLATKFEIEQFNIATGEYEEYEYDDEQDAWYQLPDEMYIYKLDLSQFTDLVRDGIVSKHEIHEWIDELSEDWGGMPAWSPAKLLDRFEIQDLTKEQYDNWKANFATESVRFRDELERRY
jgi:hypothetical protein